MITGVCGSIVEDNKDDVLKSLHKALKLGVDYVELRLDVINNITSPMATDIIRSIEDITNTPIILTNRNIDEGGYFKGSEKNRIKILEENAPLVEFTDIELATEEHLRQRVIDNANKTIISYHNFNETPSIEYLQNKISEAYMIGDIPKIALKPLTLEDTFVLVKLMMENRNMIGISMDKLGCYTRVIGPVIGSPVTYAAIDNLSAPGQLDVKTTVDIIKKLKY